MRDKKKASKAGSVFAPFLPFSRSPVRYAVAAIVVLLGIGAVASSYFPEFYHQWKPKQGAWSTYRIKDARGQAAHLTFSIVGKEGDAYWLEVRTAQESAAGTVAYLLSGDPTDDASVQKIRAQEEGQPAMEIDKAVLLKLQTQGQKAFGGEATPIGPRVGKLEPLADQAMEVAHKSLKCRHLKIAGPDQGAEIWMNDDVAPFGLVKLASGNEEVTLLDYGTGAKPTLKGPFAPVSVN